MATTNDLINPAKSLVGTTDAVITYPQSAFWNYQTTNDGTPLNTIYYSFTFETINDQGNPRHPVFSTDNHALFNSDQITAARQALSYVGDLTGINFQETESDSQVTLSFYQANIANPTTAGLAWTGASYAYTGDEKTITKYLPYSQIYLDTVDHAESNLNPAPGGAGYQILLHEIGHALGLDHPFDGTDKLEDGTHDTNTTLMSYTWVGDNKTEFMEYDKAALAFLYGSDGLRGTAGINSREEGAPADPVIASPEPEIYTGTNAFDELIATTAYDIIDGGSGIDLVTFSNNYADYTFSVDGEGRLVVTGTGSNGHRYTLNEVERLVFQDRAFALETDINSEISVVAIVTAFGVGSVDTYMSAALDVVDTGMTLTQVFDLIVDANYMPADNGVFLDQVYNNLFGVLPDQATHDLYTNMLNDGTFTKSSLLLAAAEYTEDIILGKAINLTGVETSGYYALEVFE